MIWRGFRVWVIEFEGVGLGSAGREDHLVKRSRDQPTIPSMILRLGRGLYPLSATVLTSRHHP